MARPVRIALLLHGLSQAAGSDSEPPVGELARALRDRGHQVTVLGSRPPGSARTDASVAAGRRLTSLADALLARRGFAVPLAHTPVSVIALLAGGYDVAHAFSTTDALAALLWRRLTGRPAVFTCAETLDRESLADRRLGLRLLQGASEDSDAVTAPTPAAQAGLWRWLAVDARLIGWRDADGYELLYREVLSGRR